jgi:hypothetical protein
MRVERVIMRVKAMLERAQTAQDIARLTSLLVILQNEYILELQKQTVKRKVA